MALQLAYETGIFESVNTQTSFAPPGQVQYQVKIYIENYGGEIIPIEIAEEGIVLELDPTEDHLFWSICPTTAQITILDEDRSKQPTKLFNILGFEENQVRLDIIEHGVLIFQGFVLPGELEYDTYLPGTTTLTAVSGLATLEDEPYSNAGTPYTGRDTALDIIDRIITKTGITAAKYWTSMHWYPRLTANSITGTTKDMLRQVMHDNTIYTDDDGVVLSSMDVLKDVLTRYLCRIFFWRNEWHITQRHVDLDENGSGFHWDSAIPLVAGPAGSTFTSDVEVQFGIDDLTPENGLSTIGSEGLVQTSITYNHGVPEAGLIGNPSFEAPIEAEGGTGLGNWAPVTAAGGNSATRVRSTPPADTDGGKWALQFDVDAADVVTIPDDIVLGHHVKQTAGHIEGGTGRFMTVTAWVNYDLGIQQNYGDGWFAMRWKVGTYWLTYNTTNNQYQWKEDADLIDLEHYLAFGVGQNKNWVPITFTSNEMVDLTVPVSGALYIELYQPVEDTTGAGVGVAGRWDLIDFSLTEDDGTTANTAITTVCNLTSSANTSRLTDFVVLTGTGPSETYKARITVLDNTDTEVEAESNWQLGNDYGGAATGFTIDQLWCDQALQQTQVPLLKIAGTFDMGNSIDNIWEPFQYIRRDETATLAGDYNVGVDGAEIVCDKALFPNRRIQIGSEEKLVTSVRLNVPGNYVVTMDSALSNSYNTGEVVTQVFLFTFDRFSYNVLRNSISGQWTELYLEALSNVFTTTEIKPNSQASRQLATGLSPITNVFISTGADGRFVDDLAGLQNEDVGTEATSIIMLSHTSGTELGGGVFIGDPDDTTTTADNGTVVVSGDGKRWKRVINGAWNPHWFGARLDGTTDDSAAFQALINSAPSGTQVLVPAGTALIGTTLQIDGKAFTLTGHNESYYKDDGRTGFPASASGTIFQSASGLTGPIIKIQDQTTTSEEFSPVKISRIHFVGNKDGSGTDTYAVEIVGGWDVVIRDCNINKFSSHGVSIDQQSAGLNLPSTSIRIIENTFAENGGYGLWIEASTCVISNNYFLNNDSGGFIETVGSFNNIVENNIASGNTIGIEMQGGGLSSARGNVCISNSSTGLYVGSDTFTPDGIVVSGNMCTQNGTDTGLSNELRAGMVINNVKNSVVGLNTLFDNGSYGLYLKGSWTASLDDNRGQGNEIDFSNTRIQRLDSLGAYSAIEHGALQRDNDASLRLQELIDSIPAGSAIAFPNGDYKFFNSLNINKPLRLEGHAAPDLSGEEGTYFTQGSGHDAPILIINSPGVIIDGINFVGSPFTTSASTGVQLTSAVTSGIVNGCVFKGFQGSGMLCDAGSESVRISQCSFVDNAQYGIRIAGDKYNIDQSIFKDNTLSGILGAAPEGLRIVDSIVEGNTIHGIHIDQGSGCIVGANTIRDNSQNGVYIVGTGYVHLIEGNLIEGNGTNTGAANAARAGVRIDGGSRHFVVNNIFADRQTTTTQYYAIATTANIESATILHNVEDGNIVDSFYNLDSTTADDLDIDIEAVATIDVASVGASSTVIVSVTVTGARGSDTVKLGPPTNWDQNLIVGNGFVSANDTVKFPVYNPTGSAIDPASGDWSIHLERRGGASATVPPPPASDFVVQVQFGNKNILKYA